MKRADAIAMKSGETVIVTTEMSELFGEILSFEYYDENSGRMYFSHEDMGDDIVTMDTIDDDSKILDELPISKEC